MNFNPQSEAHAAAAVDRRDCLRGVIGALLTVWSVSLDRGQPWPRADLEHWLRSVGAHAIGGGALLRRLGAAYLAGHPDERDSAQLTRLLSGARARLEVSSLSQSVARDWRAHEVALLDGWLLARTEARVCALLHLSQVPRRD
jgi:hypothetical protein